jgi:RNA polymerase sigma-70 factor (ECF subfamily)
MLMRSQRRHRAHLVGELELDEIEALASSTHDDQSVDQPAMEMEREAVVRDALSQLPHHYRDVVTAHYHNDLGLHEIAHQMNVTESAVRSRLHRARTRLRALLTSLPQGRETASFAA